MEKIELTEEQRKQIFLEEQEKMKAVERNTKRDEAKENIKEIKSRVEKLHGIEDLSKTDNEYAIALFCHYNMVIYSVCVDDLAEILNTDLSKVGSYIKIAHSFLSNKNKQFLDYLAAIMFFSE